MQVDEKSNCNKDDPQTNDPVGPIKHVDGEFMPEKVGHAGNEDPPDQTTHKDAANGQQSFHRMRKLQGNAVAGKNGDEHKDRKRVG